MSGFQLWRQGTSESRVHENVESDENQPLITNYRFEFQPYSSPRLRTRNPYLIFFTLVVVGTWFGIKVCRQPSPPGPTPYEKLLAEIAEAGDKLVVINFGATWCGECNLMKLYVVGLRRMTPNVVFLDVDIDQNREAAFHYEIAAVPTFKFLKKSKIIDQYIGANIEELKKFVKKYNS